MSETGIEYQQGVLHAQARENAGDGEELEQNAGGIDPREILRLEGPDEGRRRRPVEPVVVDGGQQRAVQDVFARRVDPVEHEREPGDEQQVAIAPEKRERSFPRQRCRPLGARQGPRTVPPGARHRQATVDPYEQPYAPDQDHRRQHHERLRAETDEVSSDPGADDRAERVANAEHGKHARALLGV